LQIDEKESEGNLNYPDWWNYAEEDLNTHIAEVSNKIKSKLGELDVQKLIKRKNPYLFCLRSASDTKRFSGLLLDAFLSSSEETMFGTIAERCAVVINTKAKGGMKSTTEGIDIEYIDDHGRRTIVQVKSGQNWGNSAQRKQMEDYFKKAKRILQQGNNKDQVVCIEGICYGPAKINNKGNYYRYIGSEFWKEISGWEYTYLALVEIFSAHAQNGFTEIRTNAIESIIKFLENSEISSDLQINWNKLVRYVNSGS